ALEIDSRSAPALDGLTKALIDQQRYSAAIAYLKNAPADPGLQVNLAIAYSRNGAVEEAIKILSSLVRQQPKSAVAHFNLAAVYSQDKHYREAEAEFREALRLDPSNDVARISMIKAMSVLAEFDAAAPLIEEYARRKPNDFEALYLMGVVDRGLGKYAES